MKKILVILVVILGLILAACSPTGTIDPVTIQPDKSGSESTVPEPTSTPIVPTQQQSDSNDLVRTDNQGAVAVMVEPLNLDSPGDTLKFEVSMNTHSVDLKMDLASLSTLSTDNGIVIQALSWDGTQGGHHVSGNLVFPAVNDGRPVLDGAKELTLTIKNIDAPERIFSWGISQ